mgnify:CR=1 FL=1
MSKTKRCIRDSILTVLTLPISFVISILLQNVLEHTVFKKDGKIFWKCRNCGFVTEDIEAPQLCPACKHAQAHFEVLADNF